MYQPIRSIVSPVNYRIIREILIAKHPFNQRQIANRASASPSQVSRVVNSFITLGFVERRRDSGYVLMNAPALIFSVFPFQRTMPLMYHSTVRGGKKEIIEKLVEYGGILCLESALEEYSEYFRAGRICIYHKNPSKLAGKFKPYSGGYIGLDIYYPDLSLKGDTEEHRRTTELRTVIDLACEGKIYAAKDLIEDLWGIIIG